ncbi:MAG: decarboxylating 6-phosphogluconate dehydrogenase [Rhodocyclaceae bacterium]|jgi:6-phosphogluconate dehydrogenase|nr:decarboxylating 6-phosphogluconate dehydrogenase [Rhodocyclaceae bacterium]
MQLGMIGLGRMGANLVARLTRNGHTCAVYDVSPAAVKKATGKNIFGAASVGDLLSKLARPRAVWMMLPASVVGATVEELAAHMDGGDIIIDGGNSDYRDDLARAEMLQRKGIHYVDVGTSGGVFGLERGFCLMIGGEDGIVEHLDPIFRSIAPGVAAAPRTAGSCGDPDAAEHGYLHCGPNGAGHFVKMVHNGIEYGLMAAYAEGLNILKNANVGKRFSAVDAETAPMRNSAYYRYDLDLPRIAEVWRRGSVISSWLLDLTAAALRDNANLDEYAGRVSDSGEGRWTLAAAIDEGVPAPVLSAALFGRFSSRGDADFANRVLSAMRKQFGGHDEKKGSKSE